MQTRLSDINAEFEISPTIYNSVKLKFLFYMFINQSNVEFLIGW